MGTIIIGVGNPVLTDDGVGPRAAAAIRERLRGDSSAVAAELYNGGMFLMEAMAGYDRAIVIDAIVSGGRPGTIYEMGLADLPKTRNVHSTHDGSLAVALEFGRMAGLKLPGEVRVWAIEAGDVDSFSEGLTPAVEQAVPRVVDRVMCYLEENPGASGSAGR